MDFPRQPEPVTITIEGDPIDVEFWLRHFIRAAEYKGDMTQQTSSQSFRIFPRAVND